MKKCINCGRELPDDASFCPYCEAVQGAVTRENAPRPWKRKACTLAAVLICLAAAFLIRRAIGPKTITAAGQELHYKGYHLILSFDEPMEEGALPEPEETYEDWLTAEDDAAMQSLLFAYSEDGTKNARHLFEDLIDHAAVETVPRDSATQMECTQPAYDTLVPDAMLVSEFYYMPQTGTNDICWTITMKNGDVLKMQHSFTCNEIPTVTYTPEDTPLATIEDLQALLDRIDAELPAETIVYIELPAVTYEGGFTMKNRAYNLVGSEENGSVTTFTGTITIESREPEKARLSGLCFTGDGTGVAAYAPVALFGCTLKDLPVGLAVYDGYADPHDSLFENCGTGMLYDCPESTRHGNLDLDGCTWRGCGIGMHLKAVANNITMLFNDCTFSGNEVDIRNDASTPIDTSGATFE